jgi:hypothetical protein
VYLFVCVVVNTASVSVMLCVESTAVVLQRTLTCYNKILCKRPAISRNSCVHKSVQADVSAVNSELGV